MLQMFCQALIVTWIVGDLAISILKHGKTEEHTHDGWIGVAYTAGALWVFITAGLFS